MINRNVLKRNLCRKMGRKIPRISFVVARGICATGIFLGGLEMLQKPHLQAVSHFFYLKISLNVKLFLYN